MVNSTVRWSAVLIGASVIGGFGYVLTKPESAKPSSHSAFSHRRSVPAVIAASAPAGSATAVTAVAAPIATPDLTFDAYKSERHNPFPTVAPAGHDHVPGAAEHGTWVLTGITAIGGRGAALVEDQAAGDSLTLRAGDTWNGRRVATVGDDSLTLVDSSGSRSVYTLTDVVATAVGAAPAAPSGGPETTADVTRLEATEDTTPVANDRSQTSVAAATAPAPARLAAGAALSRKGANGG